MNSTDSFDNENPFIIVNNFFKEYPKLSTNLKLAKNLINLELISSILSRHIKSFDLTQKDFDSLRKIKPKRIELPLKDKDDLVKVVR